MPEPILAVCMECINAKSQEEIELARRSKQIDRWPETWYLITHAHIYILFVNHYLFWKFNGSMTSFLPCSVVVLLFFSFVEIWSEKKGWSSVRCVCRIYFALHFDWVFSTFLSSGQTPPPWCGGVRKINISQADENYPQCQLWRHFTTRI